MITFAVLTLALWIRRAVAGRRWRYMLADVWRAGFVWAVLSAAVNLKRIVS